MTNTMQIRNGTLENDFCFAEVKESLKRAKEKAKSFHAYAFRRIEELESSATSEGESRSTWANTASYRSRVGYDGLGSSWGRSLSSRSSNFSGPHGKKKKANRTMLNGNSSISSISELEPVVSFDDSGFSNISSITHLTGSNCSLQFSFSNWITQGPDVFGTEVLEKKDLCAPQLPKRIDSVANLEWGNESSSSLCLEDIKEESNHSSETATTTTGRPWTEGVPAPKDKSVCMPRRADSITENEFERSWASASSTSLPLDESSTVLSFDSSNESLSSQYLIV